MEPDGSPLTGADRGRPLAETFQPLADMIAMLSADAVNVQQLFDRAHDQELVVLRNALTVLDAALGPAAVALAPSRLMIHTFEIETRVRLVVERTRGVEVKVSPLNLGYDLRYGSSATDESRIRIQVVQVPGRGAATITSEEGGERAGTAR